MSRVQPSRSAAACVTYCESGDEEDGEDGARAVDLLNAHSLLEECHFAMLPPNPVQVIRVVQKAVAIHAGDHCNDAFDQCIASHEPHARV